jgi:hypothetical protein
LNKIWWTAFEAYKMAAKKNVEALVTWGECVKAAHQVSVQETAE